jgi:predicted transcriptional regulator
MGEETNGDGEDIRVLAIRMYLQHYDQYAIAKELGVAQSSVSKWVNGMARVWRDLANQDRIEHIGRLLDENRMLRSILYRSQLSCQSIALLLKSIEMELKVCGAFRPEAVILPVATLPWQEIAAPPPMDEVERRLAAALERQAGEH